ncbi:hypothetical protein MIR68_001253 [Amoeboaphelidium protococcarum]|nr:hypothetical protein MIR68_001253 [Amoeboaphelidium protococcarum]
MNSTQRSFDVARSRNKEAQQNFSLLKGDGQGRSVPENEQSVSQCRGTQTTQSLPTMGRNIDREIISRTQQLDQLDLICCDKIEILEQDIATNNSTYRVISYEGGFYKAWICNDQQAEQLRKAVRDYSKINYISSLMVQLYALAYLSGDTGITRSKSSPTPDQKMLRDTYHLFCVGHNRRSTLRQSVELHSLCTKLFSNDAMNESLQVQCNSEVFTYLFQPAADRFGVACQNHIVDNFRKTLRRVVVIDLKDFGLGTVYKLCDLANLVLRRLNLIQNFGDCTNLSDALRSISKRDKNLSRSTSHYQNKSGRATWKKQSILKSNCNKI